MCRSMSIDRHPGSWFHQFKRRNQTRVYYDPTNLPPLWIDRNEEKPHPKFPMDAPLPQSSTEVTWPACELIAHKIPDGGCVVLSMFCHLKWRMAKKLSRFFLLNSPRWLVIECNPCSNSKSFGISGWTLSKHLEHLNKNTKKKKHTHTARAPVIYLVCSLRLKSENGIQCSNIPK